MIHASKEWVNGGVKKGIMDNTLELRITTWKQIDVKRPLKDTAPHTYQWLSKLGPFKCKYTYDRRRKGTTDDVWSTIICSAVAGVSLKTGGDQWNRCQYGENTPETADLRYAGSTENGEVARAV
jgi:hypothetical protein